MTTVNVRYIVRDVEEALAFYTQQLGFQVEMHPVPVPLLASAFVLIVVLLDSCGLPGSTISQGGGLPDLHPLNWGYRYYATPSWSPNGKWIALEAGSGVADSHLVVVSPNGRFRQDLRNWDCGESLAFDIAWMPDSTLTCLSDTQLAYAQYPFAAPRRIALSEAITAQDKGAVWSSDGEIALVVSTGPPSSGMRPLGNGTLYALRRNGSVIAHPLTSLDEYVQSPGWVTKVNANTLTYEVSTGVEHLQFDLVLGSATYSAGVPSTVVQSRVLARDVDQFYTRSPSGRWIAVRHADPHGGDRIYLLDPATPSHTLDVVVADKAGMQMMAPIWSPDGQTMIVFSVGYDTSTPYELSIGSYLKSKGLQP